MLHHYALLSYINIFYLDCSTRKFKSSCDTPGKEMWSLNSNSILVSHCKQSDRKQRVACREGSQKWKYASSNRSPRITGLASRGCIAVYQESDSECRDGFRDCVCMKIQNFVLLMVFLFSDFHTFLNSSFQYK